MAANHQVKTAKVLADRGASELLEAKNCSGQSLYESAVSLLANADKRREMSRAMKELATPRAAEDIYKALMELL